MYSYLRCSDVDLLAQRRERKTNIPTPFLLCNLDGFSCYTSHKFNFNCSMAKSFCRNFLNPQMYSGNASKLLCTWDFNITNEKAVKLKQKNLSTQIKVGNTGDTKRCKGTELACRSHTARACAQISFWHWPEHASLVSNKLQSSWLLCLTWFELLDLS